MTGRRFLSFVRLVLVNIFALVLLTCGDGGPEDPGDGGDNGDIIPKVDTIPPAAVSGLVARSPTVSTITLVWVSPGDDGTAGQAAAYDVRRSMSPIDEQNWDAATPISGVAAPKPAGELESFVAGGLPSEADIYFAVKTCDEVPNESGISNCPMSTTKDMAPWPVSDLKAVAVGETEFLLTWTATGDDGLNGTASQYDIRYSTVEITDQNWGTATQATGEPAPKTAGEPDSFAVTGLNAETNYYFALKVGDEVPNWSWLSNVSRAFAYGVNLWVTPHAVYPPDEVEITYRSAPAGATSINIWGMTSGWPWQFVLRRHLVNETVPPDIYSVSWDLRDDDGELVYSSLSIQCHIKLYWGAAIVDSTIVGIYP